MRRQNRLRPGSRLQEVISSGRRVTRTEFVLYHFAREASERPSVGLRVSRRVGGAVVRNRVRRQLREALRPLIPRLVASDIVIVARPAAAEAGVSGLGRSLADAAARAGLILSGDATTNDRL